MKPWVIYTRVSTQKQKDHGASLEAQLSACSAIAKGHEYRTIHIQDAETAKDVDQVGLHKIRELIAEGAIAGVMVYKLDRIARNRSGLLHLLDEYIKAGIQFVSVKEHIDTSGANGRLMANLLGSINQFEREQLIERIKMTNDHRRAEGAWIGGAPPIGLSIEKRGKLRFLIPHPEYGAKVAQAWPMVLAGSNLLKIASYLQGAGVPTSTAARKGRKVWARNSVSAMLKNKSAIGHLVTEDDFKKVQVALGGRSNPRSRAGTTKRMPAPSERVWRLHGIAKCAQCGSGLVGTIAHGRSRSYYYLRCAGRIQRGKDFCTAKDLPADAWEDAVVKRLSIYLGKRQDLKTHLAQRVAKKRALAGPLRAQVAKLRLTRDELAVKLSRALELAIEGGAAARAVAPRIAEIQTQLEAADTAMGTAEGQLALADISTDALEAIAEVLQASVAHLPERDHVRQRQVLQALVIDVVLGEGAAGVIRIRLPSATAALKVAGELRQGDAAPVRRPRTEWLPCPDTFRTGEAHAFDLVAAVTRGTKGVYLVEVA